MRSGDAGDDAGMNAAERWFIRRCEPAADAEMKSQR